MLTLCTAWYRVNNKFRNNEYNVWMSNLLSSSNKFKVVLFTNTETYDEVKQYECDNIHIVIKEFEDFHCATDKWLENHERNDELNHKSKHNTDYKLNMIWNEKVAFVHDAFTRQIFDTEYYCWCDIGYFRNSQFPINEWPNEDKLKIVNKDTIHYCQIVHDHQLSILINKHLPNKDSKYIKGQLDPNQESIAGGFFLTHSSNIEWWFNQYYEIMNWYLDNDMLIKDDQIIIITAFIHKWSCFTLIKARCGNKWFGFQDFLFS
jgi:hypothetical protein